MDNGVRERLGTFFLLFSSLAARRTREDAWRIWKRAGFPGHESLGVNPRRLVLRPNDERLAKPLLERAQKAVSAALSLAVTSRRRDISPLGQFVPEIIYSSVGTDQCTDI